MGKCPKSEKNSFHYISLTITRICFKPFMHIAEICVEGRVSQNVDLGLTSCFKMLRRELEKHDKKWQKLPVFCHTFKTSATKKNLGHNSLDKHVFYTYLKLGTCRSNIKRDIHVQKNKVGKNTCKFSIVVSYIFLSYGLYH